MASWLSCNTGEGFCFIRHAHLLVTRPAAFPGPTAYNGVYPKNPAFLVPEFRLDKHLQRQVQSRSQKLGSWTKCPSVVWQQKWNVQIQHAGRGQKVLDYLGRYAFRIAISNSRLERFDDGQVTFRYARPPQSGNQTPHLDAEEFITRFLQHVLPKVSSRSVPMDCGVRLRPTNWKKPAPFLQASQPQASLAMPRTEPTLTPQRCFLHSALPQMQAGSSDLVCEITCDFCLLALPCSQQAVRLTSQPIKPEDLD